MIALTLHAGAVVAHVHVVVRVADLVTLPSLGHHDTVLCFLVGLESVDDPTGLLILGSILTEDLMLLDREVVQAWFGRLVLEGRWFVHIHVGTAHRCGRMVALICLERVGDLVTRVDVDEVALEL